MAKFEKFEDIRAWQESRKFVKDIYRITNTGDFAKDYGLRDQLQRAAVSIMSNIAEGFERDTDAEFKRFLFISKASAGETRSLLYVAFDLGYITQITYTKLNKKILEVSRMIGGLIKYLKVSASIDLN